MCLCSSKANVISMTIRISPNTHDSQYVKMCLLLAIYCIGCKKLLSIKLWTSQRAWHHNNLCVFCAAKDANTFEWMPEVLFSFRLHTFCFGNCKLKCFSHFYTKATHKLSSSARHKFKEAITRQREKGWTWIMLSDEWKMRMGNECEVSVCWLECLNKLFWQKEKRRWGKQFSVLG